MPFLLQKNIPVTKYRERYQFVNERSMEHFQMNYLMDRGSSPYPPRLEHAHFWNNGVALLKELFTLRQAKVVQR